MWASSTTPASTRGSSSTRSSRASGSGPCSPGTTACGSGGSSAQRTCGTSRSSSSRAPSTRVLGPEDLRDESLIIFARSVNPRLYDWLLAQFERAGFRFAGVHEVGGEYKRDVLLAVAEGFGVALGPYSAKEVVEADAVVTRRALQPVVRMPETMVAWRESPPRQIRPVLGVIRQVAAQLRAASGNGASADGVQGPRPEVSARARAPRMG